MIFIARFVKVRELLEFILLSDTCIWTFGVNIITKYEG
jgi:hypothetical protein